MLRIILLAAFAALLFIVNSTDTHTESLMDGVTVLATRPAPVTGNAAKKGPRLTSPFTPPAARSATSQIWDRHMQTGTAGETWRSVARCRNVRELLIEQLRATTATFDSLLDGINVALNATFDFDQKIEALRELGIPTQCIFVTRSAYEGEGEEPELVLRMNGGDVVLGGAVVLSDERSFRSWYDIVRAGDQVHYPLLGKYGEAWEDSRPITTYR